jgi:hypothetical protein
VSPHGALGAGNFGRLFAEGELPLADLEDGMVTKLTAALIGNVTGSGENDTIAAGYTYFGQFIDHDLTFDASTLQEKIDPAGLPNLRTARFDLDSLYGAGRADQPYLYDGAKLVVGGGKDPLAQFDLPRNQNGLAIIGDPRNDENQITSQLHLLFLQFHNLVVDHYAKQENGGLTGDALFDTARQSVVWHYQWLVLNDYLPRIIGADLAKALKTPAKRKLTKRMPADGALPMEFAHAAFRFGHTMIRRGYKLRRTNPDGSEADPVDIFALKGGEDLHGRRALEAVKRIFWSAFFQPKDADAQQSMELDHRLSPELANVPPEHGSLPDLNLRRGIKVGLPAGLAVAKALRLADKDQLHAKELWDGVENFDDADDRAVIEAKTPLWFYILREAATLGDGKHLGPVGGHIVGEVFWSLLENDPDAYLNVKPSWKPDLWPGPVPDGTGGRWSMFLHQAYVHYRADWKTFTDENDVP